MKGIVNKTKNEDTDVSDSLMKTSIIIDDSFISSKNNTSKCLQEDIEESDVDSIQPIIKVKH